MSRRLRFQVKPNLNLPSIAPAAEEPKSAIAVTNPAGIDPNEPNTRIASDYVVSDAVDQSITTREPSPRPPSPKRQPPVLAELTDENVIDHENQGAIYPATVQTNVQDETGHEPVGQITNLEELAANQSAMEMPSVKSKESYLVQQLTAPVHYPMHPPPVPHLPPPTQGSGEKKLDWRTMKQSLKGKKLDRSTFLMRDLIYWSPQDDDEEEGAEEGDDMASVSSASSTSRKGNRKRRYTPRFDASQPVIPDSKKVDEQKSTAPQVKVNADGSIAIDESTLVIDRRDQGAGTEFETVDETWGYGVGPSHRGPRLTSMSFRRRKIPGPGKPWSKLETDKFYRILSFAGLDFTLIHELFPTRSHLELKRKYKRECNNDPARIDRALLSIGARHGPWTDLKKLIIERGRLTDDQQSQALLETARDMIEEEDERIELEAGSRKPSVAEATRIANRLSKHGFGKDNMADDYSVEQLESMAEKMVKQLAKKDKLKAADAAKKEAVEKKRQNYHVETRRKLQKKLKAEDVDGSVSPTL